MSRLIKKPIEIPANVKVDVKDGEFVFKGPLGECTAKVHPLVKVEISENLIIVRPVDVESLPKSQRRLGKAIPGTMYRLLSNAIRGVVDGYRKELKVVGTGYRVRKEGERLVFTVGYSHTVYYELPKELSKFVKVDVAGQDTVIVSGTNKEFVGLVAAQIRSIREPNVYTGKGIRYADEVITLKPTKKTKGG